MTAGIASLPAHGFGSVVIVRAQESADTLSAFRDRRYAVNESDSLSLGNFVRAALQTPVEVYKFFESVHFSGSHRQSVEMVAGYEADVAAVDSSALAHLARLYPALLEKVRVLCWLPE
ncbi:MAG: PhnD/SsuA/transferrin family substrate-binding protein [Gammaproteobacteria bacterium]